MKFLLDESADFPLAEVLRKLNHDVTSIVHDYTRSIDDEEVLDIALREGRVLIANDKDFGDLIFRQRLPHAGVILFRLGAEPIQTKISWLEHILTHYSIYLRDFIVVTDSGVRVRLMK